MASEGDKVMDNTISLQFEKSKDRFNMQLDEAQHYFIGARLYQDAISVWVSDCGANEEVLLNKQQLKLFINSLKELEKGLK